MNENKNIIELKAYRQTRRKSYLRQHGERLETFLSEFLEAHVPFDFHDLSQMYLANQAHAQHESWDYTDLREVVASALDHCLGEAVIAALRSQRWFDESFVTFDEVMDRCTSLFILHKGRAANS